MKKIKKLLIFVVLTAIVVVGWSMMQNKTTEKNTNSDNLKIDANAEVDAEMEAYIDEAFELLKTNGKESEKVWSEYKLKENAIIVCLKDDATNNIVRAWKLTTTKKSDLTNEDFVGVEIPAAGSYRGIEFKGEKAIILSVSKETAGLLKPVAITNFIYEIGVHEMVHFHYESPFKLAKLAMEQKVHGGRGTAFPKVAEPRVYRKMLYDNLVAAFENPENEELYLGKAKYWNEKWKSEYSGEYYQAKITDIMEGKARYIQYMLCIPKNLSDMEKAAWIVEHFDKSATPSESIDKESYKLGFVAGVLLDRQGAEWKNQVNKKPQSLVDYLLKNVEEKKDNPKDYKEKLKISEEQMAKQNEEIEGKLESIKKAESDIQIPFLQINEKYLEGSFETSDFLKYKDEKLVIDFGGTFRNENGLAILKKLSVYEKNGVGKSSYILPLTMDYEMSDGHLIIEDEGVSANIQVKQKKDRNGRIIYSMK